jgi:2-oxo-hept-3-ene-1,7-dioate hydratase
METAMCAQGMLVERLTAELGPPVGYKAGLTSPAAQERFGVSSPLHGVLLEGMMLEDGATVPLAFGARPIMEADLILVVGSAEINEARSPAEVVAHISAVHPFIELADLVVAEGEPLDAPVIAAINVGARLGVLGEAIAPDASTTQYLEEMTVRLEGGGEVVSEAPGAAVLGNPLNAVLFLIEAGVTLEEGDLVSVGTMGAPAPPAPGTFTAAYDGLPGSPAVSVTFE